MQSGEDEGSRILLKAANLCLDEPVDVREESGKEYDIAELVKSITRGNLHEEVNFGAPVGKEAW